MHFNCGSSTGGLGAHEKSGFSCLKTMEEIKAPTMKKIQIPQKDVVASPAFQGSLLFSGALGLFGLQKVEVWDRWHPLTTGPSWGNRL